MWSGRHGLLVLAAVLGVSLVVGISAHIYGRHPAQVLVFVERQTSHGEEVNLSVIATNRGRVPLVYHGSPPYAELRVETASGWTNLPQVYVSGRASFGFLLPGRTMSYHFAVPRGVTRVQIGCFFETGGARTWVVARAKETGAWDYLEPLLQLLLSVLPDGRNEQVEFWTRETGVQ